MSQVRAEIENEGCDHCSCGPEDEQEQGERATERVPGCHLFCEDEGEYAEGSDAAGEECEVDPDQPVDEGWQDANVRSQLHGFGHGSSGCEYAEVDGSGELEKEFKLERIHRVMGDVM